MYCPECREPGHFPWQHDADCRLGLKHQVRVLHWTLGVCCVALAGSAVLWVWMMVVLRGLPG